MSFAGCWSPSRSPSPCCSSPSSASPPCSRRSRRRRWSRSGGSGWPAWYPAGAAIGVALVLGASWSAARWDLHTFEPSARLLSYELLLVAIAVTYPIAMRAVIAGRPSLADSVITDTGPAGLGGLAAVLRDVLRDPDLRLCLWEGPELGYVDTGDGSRHGPATDRRWLFVEDETGPLVAVVHRSAALDDPPTATAVSSAVRLAVVHQQLQEELAAHVDDLGAARMRLMAAADGQRVATAAKLRADVIAPLERTATELTAIRTRIPDGEAADAVGVVVQEVTAAAGEMIGLVCGVPPARARRRPAGAAVEELGRAQPVAVTVRASPTAAADAETERHCSTCARRR